MGNELEIVRSAVLNLCGCIPSSTSLFLSMVITLHCTSTKQSDRGKRRGVGRVVVAFKKW